MSSTTRDKPSAEPGAAVVIPVPKMIEQGESGRVSRHHPEVVTIDVVGIQSPSQPQVEVLGPVDVENRKHHDLKSHVHGEGS
jgi:hypothetical protein